MSISLYLRAQNSEKQQTTNNKQQINNKIQKWQH